MRPQKLLRTLSWTIVSLAITAFVVQQAIAPSSFPPLLEVLPFFLVLGAMWDVRAALHPLPWDVLGKAYTFHGAFPDSLLGVVLSVVIMALGHGLLFFLMNFWIVKWSNKYQGNLPVLLLLPTAVATLGLWCLNFWYLQAAFALGMEYQGKNYVYPMVLLAVVSGLGLLSVVFFRYQAHKRNGSFVPATEVLILNSCLHILLLFVFFPYFGEVL